MERELLPVTKIWTRLVFLGLLLLPIILVPGINLVIRLFSCVMPMILAGTFRRARIVEMNFESQFYFAFIPFPRKKCKLSVVGYIETVYGASQPGLWTFILFGPLQFIMGWIFDFVLPALGGPYEIWLITAKGREILAWQGCSDQIFQANLKLLQSQTGAELRGRSVAF